MKITLHGEIMSGHCVTCDICDKAFELDGVSARFLDETGGSFQDVCPACLVSGPDGIRRRAAQAATDYEKEVPCLIANIKQRLADMQQFAADLQAEEITMPTTNDRKRIELELSRVAKWQAYCDYSEINSPGPTETDAQEPDDFGVCPICHKSDGYLNIGRDHWVVCHEHRLRWCVGSNLFSSWRHEKEDDWDKNAERIKDYEVVESYSFPDKQWKDAQDTARVAGDLLAAGALPI